MSASSAPVKKQSVIVQICRRAADSGEEDYCKDQEARLLQSETSFRTPESKIYRGRNLGTPHINDWYVIKDTAAGLKFTPVFRRLPQDNESPVFSRTGTASVVVGSHLYDIGGVGSTDLTQFYFSNQIRRLDTENPDGGWKVKELPAYCPNPTTTVFGDFIYIFPKTKWFSWIHFADRVSGRPMPWAYVYNTITHDFWELDLPQGCEATQVSFCASLDGQGVLVPIKGAKDARLALYLHNAAEKRWTREDSLNTPPFSMIRNRPYAISNGILYVYSTASGTAAVLNAYDIRSWKPLGNIKLPKFENLDILRVEDIFIFPVSATKLGFLWHKRPYWYKNLYYAKISVSLDPFNRNATLLKQAVLDISALEVVNCVPYSYFSDDEEEEEGEAEVNEAPYASRFKRKILTMVEKYGCEEWEEDSSDKLEEDDWNELEEDDWINYCLNDLKGISKRMHEVSWSLRSVNEIPIILSALEAAQPPSKKRKMLDT